MSAPSVKQLQAYALQLDGYIREVANALVVTSMDFDVDTADIDDVVERMLTRVDELTDIESQFDGVMDEHGPEVQKEMSGAVGGMKLMVLHADSVVEQLHLALYPLEKENRPFGWSASYVAEPTADRITRLVALEASAKGRICCGLVMHYHTNTSLKCEKCCTILVTG